MRFNQLTAVSLFSTVILGIAQASLAQTQLHNFDFQGRFLAVLSDADMEASAYIDGQLGGYPARGTASHRTSEMIDTLTLLPLGNEAVTPISLPVSNSVMGWPNNLAFTPDGQFAFITETFAPAPEGATLRSEIPSGQRLTVVSLSNLQQPQVVDQLDIGNEPRPVAVHPNGDLLVVSLRDPARPIAFIPFENGELGTPIFQTLPGLNDPEANASHIEWHPSGRFLGVTFAETNETAFYEVDRTNRDRPQIRAWGNSIMTGKLPGVGHFTPDGRHFIVTNLLWGDDVELQYVGATYSYLSVIRFADTANSNNEVVHQIVATAPVGGSAEEFAISPDGQFVVSLNMEASYLPIDNPRLTRDSSLTLLSLNPENGRLTSHSTTPFEGILPEGITFDASGNYLAVAVFDYHDSAHDGGSVDFWQLHRGESPSLEKLERSIPVRRGAHIIKLVQ
ncbi:beta-propeller fold lactonase family protein [Oculatella sp. FACHB-28]|uniref:beta-propeller fold lactonase family protein n=1 Tax=Oculatella sp. FACHB-28 TaxID=2692845 RepID=UPI001682DC94|nr:beta-propeller fold lactonase family protein [Oculatella sp. FACHB-28]MBD2057389.1 beta-propeller fold lactonase family protein [Oculatella sp. FACHB-28]